MLDDVNRIEVIRGPGAAMWGANAVNGVINIVTKTGQPPRQGGLAASLTAGRRRPRERRRSATAGPATAATLQLPHVQRKGPGRGIGRRHQDLAPDADDVAHGRHGRRLRADWGTRPGRGARWKAVSTAGRVGQRCGPGPPSRRPARSVLHGCARVEVRRAATWSAAGRTRALGGAPAEVQSSRPTSRAAGAGAGLPCARPLGVVPPHRATLGCHQDLRRRRTAPAVHAARAVDWTRSRAFRMNPAEGRTRRLLTAFAPASHRARRDAGWRHEPRRPGWCSSGLGAGRASAIRSRVMWKVQSRLRVCSGRPTVAQPCGRRRWRTRGVRTPARPRAGPTRSAGLPWLVSLRGHPACGSTGRSRRPTRKPAARLRGRVSQQPSLDRLSRGFVGRLPQYAPAIAGKPAAPQRRARPVTARRLPLRSSATARRRRRAASKWRAHGRRCRAWRARRQLCSLPS